MPEDVQTLSDDDDGNSTDWGDINVHGVTSKPAADVQTNKKPSISTSSVTPRMPVTKLGRAMKVADKFAMKVKRGKTMHKVRTLFVSLLFSLSLPALTITTTTIAPYQYHYHYHDQYL